MQLRHRHYVLVIFVGVITFNLQTALFIAPPMNDDPQRFFGALTDTYESNYLEYHYYHHGIKFALMHLMVVAPKVSKVINVLLMIPAALLFYLTLIRYLQLPKTVAASASLLASTVPGQVMIPASIESSYSVYGISLILLGWLTGYQYLTKDKYPHAYLFLMVLCSYFASESFGQSLFLLIAFSFLVFTVETHTHRRITLVICYALCILPRTLQMIFSPMRNEKLHHIDIPTMIGRVKDTFEYSTMFPPLIGSIWDNYWVWLMSILSLCLTAFIYGLRSRSKSSKTQRSYFYAYVFAIIWATSTAFPLIIFDQVFRARYGYLIGFGTSVIISLTMYLICKSVLKKQVHITLIMLSLCIISGITRWVYTATHAEKYNLSFQKVQRLFEEKEFPVDSQIVVIGDLYPQARFYRRSSGLITFISGRKDLRGILPIEYHYYDPFQSAHSSPLGMRGLMLEKPLFMFRETKNETSYFDQITYGLRWIKNEPSGSNWEIIKTEINTGKVRTYKTGQNKSALISALAELRHREGIELCDLMWAGCNEKKQY